MANQEHLDILKQGVTAWNQWRKEHPEALPDLSESILIRNDLRGANLRKAYPYRIDLRNALLYSADLSEANLMAANLYQADLIGASLIRVNLSGAGINSANLFGANCTEATLNGANLNMANLSEANFHRADLRGAIMNAATLYNTDLSNADLSEAYLEYVSLVQTNLKGANLTGCSIYGISAWKAQLDGAIQSNLIITPDHEPTITVDNLEVAQFIYLLLNNQKIRDVIDTITSKVVLILGRFTPERKVILDAIRDELRKRNYSPVLFDFEKPASRDLTETISTLAHMARFVIADITDAKSIPQELGQIVPNLPSVPVQPLILKSQREYGMFEHFTRFPWVLPVYHYTDEETLLLSLKESIIEPAEQKAQELAKR